MWTLRIIVFETVPNCSLFASARVPTGERKTPTWRQSSRSSVLLVLLVLLLVLLLLVGLLGPLLRGRGRELGLGPEKPATTASP